MLKPGFHIQVQRFDVSRQLAQLGNAPLGGDRPLQEQLGVTVRKEMSNPSGQRVPVRHAKHGARDRWYVLQERLPPKNPEEMRWSLSKTDSQVFVPMFDYLLPDPDPSVLVHFGAQTGALATALLPQSLVVKKIFLAVGNVMRRPDGQDGYRTWIGFAAVADK